MIQGDVGESMHLEEAEREGLHQHTREAGNHQEGEGKEERMSAPSAAVVIPKKSEKSKSRKNKKDTTTTLSISKQLEKQTAATNKIGQMLQSLQKDVKDVERRSELIKQIQYQIKQLQNQVSQIDKRIQKVADKQRKKI